MNPQALTQPVTPQPTTVSPQGVAAVAPNAPPRTSAIPAPPAIGAPMAPPQNPNYNPSAAMADIADYYNIPRQAALSAGQTQAQGTQSQQQYERGEAQNQLKIQNAQNSLDSSKYTVTQNANSPYGIQIVGPLGNTVSFQDYINLTGSNPAQVLASSTNKQAQQFVTAYNNLENFMQTTLQASSGSQSAKIALGDYYSANPGLENMSPQQVTSAFMSQYGEFFGQPQTAQPGSTQGVTPTFQSKQSVVNQSPYEELSAYGLSGAGNPVSQQLLGGSGNPLASLQQQLAAQQQSANQGQ
jgi:hypothetical protein